MPRSDKTKKNNPLRFHRRIINRERGFFSFAETIPYQPRGVLIGQQTADSCVPACIRMVIFDQFPEKRDDYQSSESFLRTALHTDFRGTSLLKVPEIFLQLGISLRYEYCTCSVEELKNSLQNAVALARVTKSNPKEGHLLLVEKFTDDYVAIRDPLPEGEGSAYLVPIDAFLKVWQSEITSLGQAILVK
jgi:ABC-type bacteriocin/lantibiotic exporter with double-glycine peptidase domain